jgi:L,D-peptidoglycan transpeptidase YkuD (ErfK/YbiS/YcfS/YnhG family)
VLRNVKRLVAVAAALLLPSMTLSATIAGDAACPAAIARADRLMLAVAAGMSSVSGRAALFERDAAGWRAVVDPFPVVFGRNGIGWSFDQADIAAASGESTTPRKVEGDGRTPAGVFEAGSAFGFGRLALSSYIEIGPDTVCVDDAGSALYNQVVTLPQVPDGLSHEKMSSVPQYRRGLIIKNGTDREARGGSCIFLHVWRGPDKGTAGCVAAAPPDVERAQTLFDGHRAAIAILPRSALGVLAGCGLPEQFEAMRRQ